MGRPKLLLRWQGRRLIDHVLSTWIESEVDEVFVVVRKDDHELAKACKSHAVTLIRPALDPVDMKQSIQSALRAIESDFHPKILDQCLIAPADLPRLSLDVINQMVRTEPTSDQIVVAMFGPKQSHPVRLPWRSAQETFRLGEDEGIDRIVDRHTKFMIRFPEHTYANDIDTPEEFRAFLTENPDVDRDA